MRLFSITIELVVLMGMASADTIILKSGRVIQGTYIGGTARQVRVDTGNEIQTVNVNDVLRIVFSGSAPSQDVVVKQPPGPNAPMPANAPNAITSVVGTAAHTGEPTQAAIEAEFVSVLERSKRRYDAAPNEFQKSTVRRERMAELGRTMTSRTAVDWIGTVARLETNGSGNGILRVHPLGYDWIVIETLPFGETVIPAGSPLYEQVALLSVGNKVIFSGVFGDNNQDYLAEMSLTEAGSMDEPEFKFKFSSVKPYSK